MVIAAHGYPETVRTGDVISVLPDTAEDCMTFHAGTKCIRDAGAKQLVTSGGRVLCVTALGGTPKLAQLRAYQAVKQVRFDGLHYRSDIGYRAI